MSYIILRANIREDQTLSFFLLGIVDLLQMPVRMLRPKRLSKAYSLAKLQEVTVVALKDQLKPLTKIPSVQPLQAPKQPPSSSCVRFLKCNPSSQIGLLPTPNMPKLPYSPFSKTTNTVTSKEFDEKSAKWSMFLV